MSEPLPNVNFTDFIKFDIRIGQIVKAEKLPKSKKLLHLEVYFGELGTRTILAGIANSYEPTFLIGQQVTAIVNLEPREMFGIVSQGMILVGQWEDGRVQFVQCNGVKPGGKIG